MKTRQELLEKPYYRCFTCPRFRKSCGGRPTRDMNLREWCEYMRDTRDFFHISNAYIAEKADASIKTVERIMSINTEQDIMRSTARRIEQAVIGPVGEFTCYRDHINNAEAQIEALNEKIASLEKEKNRLAKIIDKYLD